MESLQTVIDYYGPPRVRAELKAYEALHPTGKYKSAVYRRLLDEAADKVRDGVRLEKALRTLLEKYSEKGALSFQSESAALKGLRREFEKDREGWLARAHARQSFKTMQIGIVFDGEFLRSLREIGDGFRAFAFAMKRAAHGWQAVLEQTGRLRDTRSVKRQA